MSAADCDAGGGGPLSTSSSVASCDGAADGSEESSRPRKKRRLMAAGGAVNPARPDRFHIAAAEMCRIKLQLLHLHHLIVCSAGLAVLALYIVVMRRRGRKYTSQQLGLLCDALKDLASAMRATSLPEAHLDL